MSRPDTAKTYHERMLGVLVHIQEHLDEPLPLEELAAVAHFSPFHFHRVFEGMVGETIMAHIRRLRLERAALRLKFSEQPVTQIALEAGYEAHEAFTRAFRKHFGQSPTEYRAAQQPGAAPAVPSGVHYVPQGRVTALNTPATGATAMQAAIKQVAPQRVAFIRHTGPYKEVGTAWQKLCMWAGPRGLMGPQTRMLGLCHDDPDVTPPEKLRYDACLTVGPQVAAEGEVGVQTIAGGDYAMALHEGPYENLGQSYAWLCGQYIASQGREPRAAPPFEVYLNNPQMAPPDQLRTEIYVPLEPA